MIKKYFIILSIIVMLFEFIMIDSSFGLPSYELLKTNTYDVNFRSGPSTSYSIISTLPKDTYLLKLSSTKDQNGTRWIKVYDFNRNKTGYIASYLLSNSGITFTSEDANFTVLVSVDYLNVRSGPGTVFNLVKRIQKDTKLNVIKIIKRNDGEVWYKYEENGSYLFVASWYTKKVEETTKTPDNSQTDTNETSNTTNETSNTTNPTKIKATATDFINLRRGPSTDYEKLDLINRGDQVEIRGFAKNHLGELWPEVVYKGKTGYAISDYFTFDKDKVNLDITLIGNHCKTLYSTNLREGPSTQYKVGYVVPKDTVLSIVGVATNKEKWFEVKYNSKFYWLREDTITIAKEEKSTISSVTWRISEVGIDIKIEGNALKEPTFTLSEDPIRLVLTYKNTNLLTSSMQSEVPIFPLTRYAIASSNGSTILTLYLLTKTPYELEKGQTNQILHLKLPKVNEEILEISGRIVFTRVNAVDNELYINLEDLLNGFNLKMTGSSINFYGKTINFNDSVLKAIDNENYIALSKISDVLPVSVTKIQNKIFIDPNLESIEKKDKSIILTFSFPTNITKTEINGKEFYIFNAETIDKIEYSHSHRSSSTPPKIFVQADNYSIEVKDNIVKLSVAYNTNLSLSNKIIVIDPGHGSYSGQYLDVGAIGYSGSKEAYIVLDVALKLKELLEKHGAKVILTHTTVDDLNNPNLQGRVAIANTSSGDLFISIHLNSSTNKDAKGTETYYWYETSKAFAQVIQNALVSKLNTIDRGIKKSPLYVVKNVTTMPAILTEIGFISNPQEESLLKDPTFQNKVAEALLEGIERFFNVQP
ncbi:MAG: N-acetylmuramoyl-L-alanine amidase [Caldisericaceae bacterium]